MIGLGLRATGRPTLSLRLGGAVANILNTIGSSQVWGSKISGFRTIAIALDDALRAREGSASAINLDRPVATILAEFDARLTALAGGGTVTLDSPLSSSRNALVSSVSGARARFDALSTSANTNGTAITALATRLSQIGA